MLDNVKPLGNVVLGMPIQPRKSEGLIVLPFEKPKTPLALQVIACGPKCLEVKPGDKVVLAPSGGSFVTFWEDGESIEVVSIEEDYVHLIVG